jgi:signal peptidase II
MVKSKSYLFFLTALVIAVLDQLTKHIIKNGFLGINFTLNSGSLWGIFQNSAALLVWLSVLIIGVFLFNYEKIQKSHILVRLGSGMIVGGAIGNMIDRIFYKGVIDFINLGWFPSFNIADSGISVGVTILVIYFVFEEKIKLSEKNKII